MHAVIIGARGGIGAALVEALLAREAVTRVSALSRQGAGPLPEADPRLHTGTIDLTDEASVAEAATRVASFAPPELILIASGILSDGQALQPEKSYRQQSAKAFERVFAINTFGPALVAKHFLPIMPVRGRTVFAALSARVGSISDNRLGGWHAYRASKAALNMLLRNYALEQARKNPEAIIVGLHPGTVDTGLSKPFQSGVSAEKLFSPAQSAAYLLSVLDGLSPASTGRIFDWSGAEIPA